MTEDRAKSGSTAVQARPKRKLHCGHLTPEGIYGSGVGREK